MLGGILNNFIAFGLIMWFPTYFIQERGLEFGKLKYALSLPYVVAIGGILLMAWLGDKTRRRVLLAGMGYIVTGVIGYFAATAATITMTIVLFATAIFFQMSYVANEYAIIQRILPRHRVGTGTGFYNGMAMMIGGGLGPLIVGGVVSATGSYTAGILTLVSATFLAAVNMLVLNRFLKY
ncbi:MAG: MFS transporter [Deltaproteobacteria bacterium]|nr:MFS transporter [Deltaproteobacteria bacterium]